MATIKDVFLSIKTKLIEQNVKPEQAEIIAKQILANTSTGSTLANAYFKGILADNYINPLPANADSIAKDIADNSLEVHINKYVDAKVQKAVGTPGKWKRLRDVVSVSDTIAPVMGQGNLLYEGINVNEIVAVVKSFNRALTDDAVASDTMAKAISKVLSDTALVSEILSTLLDADRPADESISVSENLSWVFGKALAETINASDSVDLAKLFGRSALDNVSATDSIVKLFTHGRSYTDITNVTDSPVITKTIIRALHEYAFAHDTRTVTGAGASNLPDDTWVYDTITRVVNFVRSYSDVANVSDSLIAALAMNRSLLDSADVSDSLIATKAYNRSLLDIVNVSDNYADDWAGDQNYTETPSDSLSISDSGVANLQNYADDYFAQDFVGTNYNF